MICWPPIILILWLPSFPTGISASYSYDWNTILGFNFSRSPNYFNAIAPFSPLYMFITRTSGFRSLIGIPAGIRYITPKNYDPGDQEVYGGDTWEIFPAHKKSDTYGDYIGYAVLNDT